MSVSSRPIKTLTASTEAVQTCVFPATQCAGPSIAYLPTGTYTATVRAQGEAGWGPGATIDFGVTTMPPGGPDGGTPEQITTVFGSDALYAVLFDTQATPQALEDYITTPAGRQDFERLMFSAPQTVLNSSVAMNKVVGSPTALETVILDPPVYGSYTISSAAMRAILANNSALSSVVESPTAMSLIATSRSAMTVLANSPTGMTAVLASTTALNEVANSSVAVFQVVTTPSALNALVSSTAAVTTFVESSSAMSTLVGSSAAMQAFAGSATAMGVLADSFSAMNTVATSTTARTAITNSATAMTVVNGKSVALGKLVAGAAGLDPQQYSDITAVIASPVAMNSVAPSSSARSLVANSTLAMGLLESNEMALGKYAAGIVGVDPTLVSGASGLSGFSLTRVFANNTAWNILTRSEAGITALAGSSAAMATVAANSGMYNDLLGETVSLNAIAGSDAARTAFLSSSFTSSIIGYDSRYMAKFLAGAAALDPTGFESMDDLTGNSSAWQTVVSSTNAVNTLVTSPYARSQVTGSARTTLFGSTMAVAKMMVADAQLSPAGYDSITQLMTSGVWASIIVTSDAAMATLALSPAGVSAVGANSTAVTALMQSVPAVTAMLARPAAVDALVTSSTAMDAISTQASARASFSEDAYALSKIRSSKMSIGKLVAGLAGLTPAGFADIDALAINVSAMDAIASSTAAVTALAGSDVGTQSVTTFAISANALAGSGTAMSILRDSPIAMLNFAASAASINAMNASEGALNSVKESAVAMDAIANSTTALGVFLYSTTAMPIFTASPTAMDSLSSNPLASSRILANSYPLGQVRNLPESIGKFAAGVATNDKAKVSEVISAASLSRMNLMPNPSSETNITGWVSGGSASPSLSRNASVGWTGAASLQVTSSVYGSNVSQPRYTGTGGNGIRVDGLHKYVVSAYVRSEVTRTATISLEWRNNAGNVISTSASSTTALTAGGWTRLHLAWEAPQSAVTAVPIITIDSVQFGETQYIDGLLMEKSTRLTPNPYFDGSTSGGTWDGTANASTSQWGILSTVLGNVDARAALFGSAAGMGEIAYESRVVDALRATSGALAAAEASTTADIVRTGVARADARRLINTWASALAGATLPGVGERLRVSLGASYGTGAVGRLYSYDNDTSAASMTEAYTPATPALVPTAGTTTRFDLTNATDNLAMSPTNICIAVNYNGQTVTQEYRGYVDGSPVNNCSSDTIVSNSTTVARTLTNPTVTASSVTTAVQIGQYSTLSGSGTNVLRQEWAAAEKAGVATASTSIVYNANTGARAAQYRVIGSGGEAHANHSISVSALLVSITMAGAKGGNGGTSATGSCTPVQQGGIGAPGAVVTGVYNVTSLPVSLVISGQGPAGGNGINGVCAISSNSGGAGMPNGSPGASGVGGSGGGGGYSPSITVGGTLILRARGGSGGAGGTYSSYSGGAGGDTSPYSSTSGAGVTSFNASAGTNSGNTYVSVTAPTQVAYSSGTLTSNTTITIPAQ